MLTQVEYKELKGLREQLLAEQNNICYLCGTHISPNEAVVDHDHKTGLIRGVLHSCCNSIEGAFLYRFIRGGGQNYCDLQTYITNLIKYYDKEQLPLIHPNEKPKQPKLMKSSYNELVKTLNKLKYKKPIPPYPKSKKITVKLKALYEEYQVTPKFYTKKTK